MQLMILKRVTLRHLPDVQTISYVERVKSWLGQWTVANNFTPVLVDDEDECVNVAAALWKLRMKNSMLNAIPEVCPKHRDFIDDFLFEYSEYKIEVGAEAKYQWSGSF